MDLIALAIPFFLLALLAELVIDKFRGTGFYRANDAVNSLSAGTLSTTSGYFTGLLPTVISAWVLQHFAILEIDLALFDLSLRGLIFWMFALVAFDFCYYWAHRMGHEMSILWAAHAVHHQSEDYNLSTALRQTSTGFLFSWIFYLPLFLLGMPFEVFVTVNALDLIYQFWVHTQHIGKLGWLDRVMVTPSNHRVHHAQNEIYIDRNYGGIFILWDRLWRISRSITTSGLTPAIRAGGRTRSVSGFDEPVGGPTIWKHATRNGGRTYRPSRSLTRRWMTVCSVTSSCTSYCLHSA
jgi:sterol desaturase/sphingolipid hydroxylase (fatty acid hydroxylase superfamily)